jgi:hypothetical protein
MKTVAKILSIIALAIGIIWAFVGLIGSFIGGVAVGVTQDIVGSAGVPQDLIGDSSTTVNTTVSIMFKLVLSFVVVIIAGILGIVGSDKQPARVKTMVLGALTFISGIGLLPLHNWVAAVLFVIAGFLLILAGAFTKVSTENKIE